MGNHGKKTLRRGYLNGISRDCVFFGDPGNHRRVITAWKPQLYIMYVWNIPNTAQYIYIYIYICYTDVTLMCIPYLYIFAKALMEEGHVKVKTQSFSFSPMDVWWLSDGRNTGIPPCAYMYTGKTHTYIYIFKIICIYIYM